MKNLWSDRFDRNRSAVACWLFMMMIMMIAQVNKTVLRTHADNVVCSTSSSTLFRTMLESVLDVIVFVMWIIEKIKIRCTALFQEEEVFQFFQIVSCTTVLHVNDLIRTNRRFESFLILNAIFRSLVNNFSWFCFWNDKKENYLTAPFLTLRVRIAQMNFE